MRYSTALFAGVLQIFGAGFNILQKMTIQEKFQSKNTSEPHRNVSWLFAPPPAQTTNLAISPSLIFEKSKKDQVPAFTLGAVGFQPQGNHKKAWRIEGEFIWPKGRCFTEITGVLIRAPKAVLYHYICIAARESKGKQIFSLGLEYEGIDVDLYGPAGIETLITEF